MQVRVGLKLTAPSVQDRQSPKFGPEMLGIASDVQESLRDSTEEQAVELALIGEDQWAEVLGQGKDIP